MTLRSTAIVILGIIITGLLNSCSSSPAAPNETAEPAHAAETPVNPVQTETPAPVHVSTENETMAVSGDFEEPIKRSEVGFEPEHESRLKARAIYMIAVMAEKTDPEKALQLYKKCIALAPANPHYYEKLGFLYSSLKPELGMSTVYFEKAAENGTDNAVIYFNLAEQYKAKGDRARAIFYYEGFLKNAKPLEFLVKNASYNWNAEFSPEGYKYWRELRMVRNVLTRLAEYYREDKDTENYKRILIMMNSSGSPNESFKVLLSAAYFTDHEFQNTLKTLNSIRNVYDLNDEDFLKILDLYGKLLRVPGFLPDKIREGLFDKLTNFIDTFLTIRGSSVPVLIAGVAITSQNDGSEKAEEYAVKLFDEDPSPRFNLYSIQLLYKSGMNERALKLLTSFEQKAGARDRDLYSAVRSGILFAAGDKQQSDTILQQALKRSPDRENDLYMQVARFLTQAERYEEGLVYLEKERASGEGKVDSAVDYAYALYRTGNYSKAVSVLRQELGKEYEDKSTLNNLLGYLFALEKKNLKEAASLIQKALEVHPESAAFTDSLGWVYFQSGDLPRAETLLRKANELMQGDNEILQHLGDLYFSKGMKKEARKYWIDSYIVKPDKKLLEKINKLN